LEEVVKDFLAVLNVGDPQEALKKLRLSQQGKKYAVNLESATGDSYQYHNTTDE
jgi:hypothetical protein